MNVCMFMNVFVYKQWAKYESGYIYRQVIGYSNVKLTLLMGSWSSYPDVLGLETRVPTHTFLCVFLAAEVDSYFLYLHLNLQKLRDSIVLLSFCVWKCVLNLKSVFVNEKRFDCRYIFLFYVFEKLYLDYLLLDFKNFKLIYSIPLWERYIHENLGEEIV